MLKDVNFFETDTEIIRDEIVKTYADVTGRSLGQADPVRLFLYSIADELVQLRVLANYGLKQNLLYYAVGDNLDHLGYLVDCQRLEASRASVTIEIKLSAVIGKDVIVPAGTRVATDDNKVFVISTDKFIYAGEISTIVQAEAEKCGVEYNGYVAGMIKNIIDPIAYVSTMINITKSEGGADEEDDESYRQRIHEAPESFSTAGSYGGYRYYAMKTSSLIADVAVSSPSPGVVLVQPILTNGQLPDEEMLNDVKKMLNDKKIRPLTDLVTVEAPYVKEYVIDLVYYIANDDKVQEADIKDNVKNAISDFTKWQSEKLGRDINPTELYHRLRVAGVKFALIKPKTKKQTTTDKVSDLRNEMAKAVSINVVYGGAEDG